MNICEKENNLMNFQARQYQLELLEYVTRNNGIIYLPTGAGKTFVAILALKRFSAKMDKTIENGGKRGIFMCKTVELARQQAFELCKHTSLRVGLYLGERGVDSWSTERWKKEIDENQVLVGTAQIFVSIVSQNIIKITDLSIVIIDECHHGTKKDAMHEFMRIFQSVRDTAHLPRVIGLTGVLLKGNKLNNIMDSLRNLEVTFHGKIITVSSREEFLNVLIHSTSPVEQWLLYETDAEDSNIYTDINSQVNCCLSLITEFDIGNHPVKWSKGLVEERGPSKKRGITKFFNDFCFHLNEYGLYSAFFVLQAAIIQLDIKQRQADTIALRRMYRIVITYLESIRHMIIRKFKDFLNDDTMSNDNCHTLEVIFKFSTSKVTRLLQHIESTFCGKKREDVSCLLFVERRLTAKALCQVIQKFVDLTSSIKDTLFPEFMVGRDSMFASVVENVLERKWNKNVMSDFRKGIYNMIICSNVLEEGIDVQACNYVIVFDPLKTFNSYIQTKGRARKKDSIYVVTAAKSNANEASKQVQKYQEIHESVRKFLIERIIDNPHPNQDEIDMEFADKIPPLRSAKGAFLLASSALSMLTRYCQMLPWDVFGCILAQFRKLKTTDEVGVVVSVKLPLQSRVKEEILSDPMENVNLAKCSAAIKACRRLYEEGELNENLQPTSRKDCLDSVSHVLFKHWDKYQDDVASIKYGKTKLKLCERKCPEAFYNAMPSVGEVCYAYKIVIVPEFTQNEYNSHVVDSLKTNSKHALLLRKRLPLLAPMPLFMRQGALKVYIEDRIEFTIDSEEQLTQLRKYHYMIFRDILQCWRSYCVNDLRNKQNSFLIVPLCDNEIDWATVQRFERLKALGKPTLIERQNLSGKYKPEDWLGKIIGKWYSADDRERYIVTNVHTEKTPLSEFIDGQQLHEQYKSYLDYFEKRYGNVTGPIVDHTQFLVEVKPLTARRNFFNNAKYKNKEIKRDSKRQLLLPELCHNFDYPGDLWLQALFLPSILHRLHFLLHAEHLRQRVNTFLGIANSLNDYTPQPLVIDVSLRRAVDIDGNACALNKEVPVLLPPLAHNTSENILPESCNPLSSTGLWNTYEEPINFARRPSEIYPVELQYFYNFEQRWKFQQDLRDVSFTNNQLQMATYTDKPFNMAGDSFSSLLAINDQSLEERRRIKILERSFPKNDLQTLVTAEQHEILAALTTSSANDVFDMERFELLGDSFLKLSISLYLANKFPKWHEGFLTEVKSKFVSNRNLLYCMLETDIPTRICSNTFSMHEWLPPLVSLPENILDALENDVNLRTLLSMHNLYQLELDETEVWNGRCNDKNFTQFMDACKKNETATDDTNANCESDLNFCTYTEPQAHKVIADTLEGLLGVCVKNYGINMSFRMLEFFGICRPEDGDKPLTSLLDLNLGGSHLRTELTASEIDAFLINHKCLETNLGYTFRDRAYLLQALTHPSFPTNRITGCYQELEFIGDAILDMLITCYIFERNQTMTPGMLTDLRAALVNNITLACICVRHRFHLFLLAENVLLAELIQKFAEFQETQGHRVTDQIHILMEENDTISSESKMNIAQNVEVPKVLGDIVEALISAVYLDSRCIHTTWNVIYRLFERELNEFSHKVPIDPVRQLHEHPSAKPKFENPITDRDVTAVKCVFMCMDKKVAVNGFGANKWQAKKAAAKHALRFLAKS